ncbi:MAG: phosphomannomutase/phosphoglucomutase [Pseudoxanthomonas sp.]
MALKLGISAAEGGRLPLLAALLLVLAGWFGWGAWSQWQDQANAHALEQARDAAVAAVGKVVGTETARLDRLARSAAVKAAVVAGDSAAVGMAIRNGWKDVRAVELLPADLGQAYADPQAFGYSKLALLEQAQLAGAAVVHAVRDGNARDLGLAVPVEGQIVYVRVPLQTLTAPVASAQVEDAYLGLRQGGATLAETGEIGLSGSADALSRPVGTTGLRVVAGLPDARSGPLGFGRLACAAMTVLLAVAGAALLLLARGSLRLPVLRRRGAEQDDHALTLGQTLKSEVAAGVGDAAAAPPPDSKESAMKLAGKSANVDPGIFRAYDIRGVVGQTLSVPVAELIGQAIGSVMAEQGLTEVVVGRDGRLSGPELAAGLIEGLRQTGRDVIDIGMVPTPVAYFAAYHLRTGTCVSVTGSHNPPDYNGFKIVIGGQTLSGAAITDLYRRIAEGRLLGGGRGNLQQREIVADYIQRIADDVQLDRPLKVVADAGNGVAGALAPELLEAIGAQVVPLYCEVDGTFPNHHPDPSEPHNLEDLITTVKRFDADLGLAFDGDGDRLGVVTRDGHIIFPDCLLMLFAADVLERNPGALVIYDVKCTGKLQGWILRHGGTPLMWQTGHSLIKAKMRESEAALAGEMSGHFFFQERWFGFDDGLYSAARLLEILAARAETPSEVLDALPDGVSTPEIKVEVPEALGTPHAIVKTFVEQAAFDGARLSTIDGLRADWDDGWGLVRASNTTPVLVLRFEADDPAALERIRTAFRAQLAAVAPQLPLDF